MNKISENLSATETQYYLLVFGIEDSVNENEWHCTISLADTKEEYRNIRISEAIVHDEWHKEPKKYNIRIVYIFFICNKNSIEGMKVSHSNCAPTETNSFVMVSFLIHSNAIHTY